MRGNRKVGVRQRSENRKGADKRGGVQSRYQCEKLGGGG